MLRGPERVAFELRLAEDLKDDGDPTNDDEARLLYERSLRACGTGEVAASWAEVTTGMNEAAALDLETLAAAAEPYQPGPHLAIARTMFAAGEGERAFEALLVGLPLLDGLTRQQRLGELAAPWHALRHRRAARLDGGAGRGARAPRGRPRRARGALLPLVQRHRSRERRHAQEPRPGVRRAGTRRRRGGGVQRDGREAGARLAGQALLQVGRPPEAVRVLRAALLGSRDGVAWAQLGAAAWVAEDDETACDAFERAFKLREGQLALQELHPFRARPGLGGRHDRAEVVARRMLAYAAEDPMWRSKANHGLARALLGQGRVLEAVPAARSALADDPIGEDAAAIADTLSRATRGEMITVETPRWTPAARAFAALADGDVRAAASIVAGEHGWAAARAALAAASFRTDGHTPVSYGALQLAITGLDGTNGATALDAVLWRCAALSLREDAHFPTDTPPPLGPRLDW